MDASDDNFSKAIADSVERLITRAADARGLLAADVRVRVEAALQKYLFREGSTPERRDITAFVDELRADDLCLIIACEKGDDKAWEDLVKNFDPTVKSAARKISSNSEDAEDLASSIWAELYGLRQDRDGRKKSKLAYYSGRGSLAGWLRAVVSQLAIDEYRKQSKFVQIEETREFENAAEQSSNHTGNSELLHHAESPEAILSEKRTAGDVADSLAAAVAKLPDEDRLILKLYYFEDLKLKDIAATFGYHEATASRRLTRVQADLRKAVEAELRKNHGWNESEVKRHLAEAAASLGVNLEQMFAAITALVLLQDFWR